MSVDRKNTEVLKRWFGDKYNLALVGVILFAFILRLYYFILTKDQALWWDEAEYLANAKMWAFGIPYDLNPQRPPLFQFIASLFFSLGLGELTIKFCLTLIPSVFLVFAIYLLGKEMYSREVGLIGAFLAAVSWTFLFWTARVQPDFASMSFQVLAIFFMWRYWKKDSSGNVRYAILAGVCAALGLYLKVSGLLIPIIFLLFILLKDGLSAIKNKGYYYFALAFIVTLIPYFIWAYMTFGTPVAFAHGYSNQVTGESSSPFGWYNLNFFYVLTENVLFFLFLAGLVISLRFILYLDVFIKERKKMFDPRLFSVLSLLVISAFYIFYIRGTEDRWVFLWLPFIFYFAGLALMTVYGFTKKHHRLIALIIVLALLAWVAYAQINHADSLIRGKLTSYAPVKEGGLWLAANSVPGDKVLSISYTQTVYYSGRNVSSFSEIKGEEEFMEYINENKPRYIQTSIFEPHPEWIWIWINNNQQRLTPAYASFADSAKQQPTLIIYEVRY